MSLLQPPIWSKHPRSDTSLFRFVRNGRAGWIDAQGRVVIPPKFVYTSNFNFDDFFEGFSTNISEPPGGGIVFRTDGSSLPIPANFLISRFSEGVVAVNGQFLDRTGRVVIPGPFEHINHFSDGLAAVRIDGKWGYIDHSGNFAIAPYLYFAESFVEGIATVAVDGPCVAAPNDHPFGAWWSMEKLPLCRFIAIDKRGVAITRKTYARIDSFSEGLALVSEKGRVGCIDKEGRTRIQSRLKAAGRFREGLAPFTEEGRRWGYMNVEGRTIIPQQFHHAASFSDGAALVGDANGKLWYIDKHGNRLFKGKEFTAATSFHLGLAHVANGDSYAYINRRGEEVFRYHQSRNH